MLRVYVYRFIHESEHCRDTKCIWILFSNKNVEHDLSNFGFRTFV